MSKPLPPRPHRAGRRQQELLLQAALLEGPASLAAWKRWTTRFTLDDLDYDSQRLLPLLYRALRRQNISASEIGRLKGVYRRTWVDNARRFRAGAAVLHALHDAGIATMLLKDAALAVRYYRDIGLRPALGFDILVPADRGAGAIDVLRGLGLTPLREQAARAESGAPFVGPVYPFRGPHGDEIHLHRHVFDRDDGDAADAELWAAASPCAISGAPTLTMSAADQLLHVCVPTLERAEWDGEVGPHAGWVADAMMILRNAPDDVDWNRLLAEARRRHSVLPMRKALHYLRDLLRVGLPEDAARIYRVHLPLAECITERARMSSSNRWGPWLALGVRYMECSSTFPPGTGVLRRVAGLPAFFQRRWGSASLWRLPFEAAFRMLRRLLWAHQRCIEPRRAIKTPTRETA